jgi:plastocyanin
MNKRVLLVIAVIALAALVAGPGEANAGGSCHGGKTELKFSDVATTSVAATECTFVPTVARVDTGQTVTFHNKDVDLHTVTGALLNFGDYKEYEQGESVTHTFDKPGVYPYFCELHPGMVGAIVVGDGSAVADTGRGSSAVSAISVGQADEPDAATSDESGDSGTSTAGIAGALAALGAVLGCVGLAPVALKRLRSRS